MGRIHFTLLYFLIINVVFTQSIRIEVNDLEKTVASFSYVEGEKVFHIDSIYAVDNKYFKITANKYNLHNGFYRLIIERNKWIDFIYYGKSVELITSSNDIFSGLEVIDSRANQLYNEFNKLNKSYKTKTELLNIILSRYPKDDNYYSITEKRLAEIKREYLMFINKHTLAHPSSLIARYIKSAQLPVIIETLPFEKHIEYLKEHSLDYTDFDDAELIYSNAFTNKSIEYLTYYRNPQLPKELLEKEFMKAVDVLLNKSKINPLVYQHITNYLIEGFKKFGFDKIIDYILENYVVEDDLCLDEETENSIKRRIDQSKLLSVGAKAPNLIMQNKDGRVIDLSKIESEKTLLVFYASWCPHCQELMPKLNKINNTNKDITILAISLDSKKEDWLKFLHNNNLDMTNLNDPNGWDGTAASDYHIYATPTMFLLKSDKKIIGKPTNYEELRNLL